MTVPEAPACRECHSPLHHKLSCSHVRYEGRTVVVPQDEVVPDREPPQPYCPGPEVACYYSGEPGDQCAYSDGPCYYGTTTVEDWKAARNA